MLIYISPPLVTTSLILEADTFALLGPGHQPADSRSWGRFKFLAFPGTGSGGSVNESLPCALQGRAGPFGRQRGAAAPGG